MPFVNKGKDIRKNEIFICHRDIGQDFQYQINMVLHLALKFNEQTNEKYKQQRQIEIEIEIDG